MPYTGVSISTASGLTPEKTAAFAALIFGVRGCVNKMATEKLVAIGKARIAPRIMPQATQTASAKQPSQGRRRLSDKKNGSSPKMIPEQAPPMMKGNK
ncbi:MAG: hypothetical protein AAFZ17_15515 [Cyanobacteria bacterium J06650_10]